MQHEGAPFFTFIATGTGASIRSKGKEGLCLFNSWLYLMYLTASGYLMCALITSPRPCATIRLNLPLLSPYGFAREFSSRLKK